MEDFIEVNPIYLTNQIIKEAFLIFLRIQSELQNTEEILIIKERKGKISQVPK